MSCRSLGRFSPLSLVLLSGLLLATGGTGCDSTVKRGFSSVSTGMTQDEVRGLLGDPSVVVPGETGKGGAKITGPRWQYGDNLSTISPFPFKVYSVLLKVFSFLYKMRNEITLPQHDLVTPRSGISWTRLITTVSQHQESRRLS